MKGQHVRDTPLGKKSSDSDVSSRNREEHAVTVLNDSCLPCGGSSCDVHSTIVLTACWKGMDERTVGVCSSLSLKLALNVSLARSAVLCNLILSFSFSSPSSLPLEFLRDN